MNGDPPILVEVDGKKEVHKPCFICERFSGNFFSLQCHMAFKHGLIPPKKFAISMEGFESHFAAGNRWVKLGGGEDKHSTGKMEFGDDIQPYHAQEDRCAYLRPPLLIRCRAKRRPASHYCAMHL